MPDNKMDMVFKTCVQLQNLIQPVLAELLFTYVTFSKLRWHDYSIYEFKMLCQITKFKIAGFN